MYRERSCGVTPAYLKMDGLELGKDAEHVEERLAGSGRGVHRLFGGGEKDAG